MRFDRLDLNLLVALDVLIEERNVSAAAKRIHISQPALTGALNRLREFFDDEILVKAGRKMVLTPKAEELAGPVREALLFIKSNITTPSTFDPGTATRQFTVVASDYAYNVLLADVLAEASRIAPGITFEIMATDRLIIDRMERGEADVVMTIGKYLSDEHPRRTLFRDEHVAVCCANGRYSDGISAEQFAEAGHAIAYFGAERYPAFSEVYFEQEDYSRKIEIRVPSFAALPQAVIGTNRIATMHRRHAENFQKRLPIVVHPMPIKMPDISEDVQWNSWRNDDKGLQWLVAMLVDYAKRL